MNHVDLFSGIGGFALAAEWAGFETIVFCEKDDYCQKILKKHWPEVPIIPEIRDFKWPMANSESTRWATRPSKGQPGRCCSPTLLTGGFPCQPFSIAGKRRGKDDDRFLWPEMFRVICEIRPTWVLAENVTGIIRMELENCLSDLEREEYETETFIIPACAVDAPHRRDRIWIVAHNNKLDGDGSRFYPGEIPQQEQADISRGKDNVADDEGRRFQGQSISIRPWKSRQATCDPNGSSQDVANARSSTLRGKGGRAAGRTENERRGGPKAGGEAICTGEETSLTGDARSTSRTMANGESGKPGKQKTRDRRKGPRRGSKESKAAAVTSGEGPQDGHAGENRGWPYLQSAGEDSRRTWATWPIEPDVGRVAHGIPSRVDRLKCLGNAIVPQVAYEIMKIIKAIEMEKLK